MQWRTRDVESSSQSLRDRVVAVFTTGQLWQFKQYKWHDPKELFRHGKSLPQMIFDCTFIEVKICLAVRGVYMHYTNDPINPLVQDWKVHAFGVGRTP